MKRIFTVIATIAAAVMLLAGCQTAPQGDSTFTVGFDKEFPPMGFVADDGSYTGFDLDLAAEAADRLGMELVLQPIDWTAKNMELDSGNIDCVWNGFTINGREDEYTWTQPYMNNNQIVVVLADSPINSFADITGGSIAVQDDSSALSAIEGNEEFKSLPAEIIKTASNLNALMELESGAVDAVVMDECVARYTIEKKGAGYRVLDEVVGAEEFGIGFKLGNTDLRDKVEETLLDMADDGTLASISNDWFAKDITTIGK
ncbi:MAG: amino acid ABC transporter substrate-binding protein [Acetanaerobacterium sp.]